MSTPAPTRSAARPARWLPDHVDGRIRVFAWLSFLAEVIIIGTGGAVRLTGSGLGCPTWPTCTADSLVPTPEMGVHGIIEFGNRTMTGLVGVLAVVVLVLVLRLRRTRPDLFALAAWVLAGVLAQALVGGVTVLTGLNPFIVGFHYVCSLALVCLTAAFLVLMRAVAPGRRSLVPRGYRVLALLTATVMVVVIAIGVLTTGAGPHSGDAEAGRNGFDVEALQHLHAIPGYVLFGLSVLLVLGAWRYRLAARAVLGWSITLVGLEIVQILVGLFQARNGLPEVPVATHMVLAGLLAATMTALMLRSSAARTDEEDQNGNSGSTAMATNSSVR